MSDPVDSFLAGSPYLNWSRLPLAGDASGRRYQRLGGPVGTAVILMETPPGHTASLDGFVRIGRHLSAIGLCPPEVLLADPRRGLLLIEDLGPRHFAQWLTENPEDEGTLYAAAVDVLVAVQSHQPPQGLAALTPAYAARMIDPLLDWYAPNAPPEPLVGALEDALQRHAPHADVLALRDFHAENLIWRPTLRGTDRVGLLDYQDAVLAPPEYDLVSLLRDARRDVGPEVCEGMIKRFARLTGADLAHTRAACACLGVQRNLRILGIFARLARRDGKTRYLDLMPRVWRHIQTDLQHPALAKLAPLIAAHIPAPR